MGFTTIDNSVIDSMTRGEISYTAFALFALLKRHADKSGRCWPKQSTLSDELNASVRTVRRSIDELTGCGLLGTRRTTRGTVYQLSPHSDRSPVSAPPKVTGHQCPVRPDTSGRSKEQEPKNKVVVAGGEENQEKRKAAVAAVRKYLIDQLQLSLPSQKNRASEIADAVGEHGREIHFRRIVSGVKSDENVRNPLAIVEREVRIALESTGRQLA